ncbi:MAG: helix-turn-helix transcriptional regulator [Clostridia bacterium]|nr:helix-turn-helix transcriptional regulator [Clostridia bacterium]
MPSRRFVTYTIIEEVLETAFQNRSPLDIFGLYEAMKEIPLASLPTPYSSDPPWGLLSDADFALRMNAVPIPLQKPQMHPAKAAHPQVSEHSIFSSRPDSFHMMIHRQYNFLHELEHMHDYVEVYYVIQGRCTLHIAGKSLSLVPGDFIFIAPGAGHSLESNEKVNFILDLSVRGSSFESLFLKQLSFDTVLSAFFRKIIYDKAELNYILFHTHEDPGVKHAIKNIAMETSLKDPFNEIVYTSWTNIIFSILLRRYHADVETDPLLLNTDFSRILAYISDHYDTVTLDDLSDAFNYSKPHLCNLIKSYTGRTFTSLVNQQKLYKAEILLTSTDFPMQEIAEIIGFTSVDYFIRLFKRTHDMTPGQYRKTHQCA